MLSTSDPDPAAAGVPSTEAGERHQSEVRLPQQVGVRRRNDDPFRWGRRHLPLVAGVGVAALAVLFVRVWRRRSRGPGGIGPLLSSSPKTYRVYATREGLVGG